VSVSFICFYLGLKFLHHYRVTEESREIWDDKAVSINVTGLGLTAVQWGVRDISFSEESTAPTFFTF
jgi:hypothetical protein